MLVYQLSMLKSYETPKYNEFFVLQRGENILYKK